MKTIKNNPWIRAIAITCISISLLMVTGCGGCRDDANQDAIAKKKEEEEKKKKEKPKDDFEYNTPVLLPAVFPKPKKR